MTDKISLTLRLSPDHYAKLEQIKDETGASTKSETLRRLIDEASKKHQPQSPESAEVNGNQAPTPEPAPASTDETYDSTPGDSGASVVDVMGESTIAEDDTQDDEFVAVVADGGEVALEDVQTDSMTAKLDPFNNNVDYSNVPQNEETRRKVIRCALNYLRGEKGVEVRRKRELRRILDELFAYNERSLDRKVDEMIERGDVLPDILEDPLLEERVDTIVSLAYENLAGKSYESQKEKGRIPESIEECLGSWYHQNENQVYYLDEDAYVSRVEEVLETFESELKRRYKKKDEGSSLAPLEERYALMWQTYERMLEVVESRGWRLSEPIVENVDGRRYDTLMSYRD